jgi:shikimate kinase
MGAGKTLVGALVAERSHAQFFDLDTMVEDKAGMSVAEIFAIHSEEVFRAFEKEALPTVLKPGAVVALGGGVVMDDENWLLVSSQAITVYLELPFSAIWERIHPLPGRPLAFNRTAAEVERLFNRRRARYEEAAHRVDATQPAGSVADEVIKIWSA